MIYDNNQSLTTQRAVCVRVLVCVCACALEGKGESLSRLDYTNLRLLNGITLSGVLLLRASSEIHNTAVKRT